MNVEELEPPEESPIPAVLLASGAFAALFLFMGAIVVAHRTPGATTIGGYAQYLKRTSFMPVWQSLAIALIRDICSPEAVAGIAVFPLIRAFKVPRLRAFANIQCAIACALLALMLVANTYFKHEEPYEAYGPYPDLWVTTTLAYYGFVAWVALRSTPRPWYAKPLLALAMSSTAAALGLHAFYGSASPIDFAGAACAGGTIFLSGVWLYDRYR